MAHFYGEMKGPGNTVTRTASIDSGMYTHIRGRDVGVWVSVVHYNSKDVVRIWRTPGSNKSEPFVFLARLEGGEES